MSNNIIRFKLQKEDHLALLENESIPLSHKGNGEFTLELSNKTIKLNVKKDNGSGSNATYFNNQSCRLYKSGETVTASVSEITKKRQYQDEVNPQKIKKSKTLKEADMSTDNSTVSSARINTTIPPTRENKRKVSFEEEDALSAERIAKKKSSTSRSQLFPARSSSKTPKNRRTSLTGTGTLPQPNVDEWAASSSAPSPEAARTPKASSAKAVVKTVVIDSSAISIPAPTHACLGIDYSRLPISDRLIHELATSPKTLDYLKRYIDFPAAGSNLLQEHAVAVEGDDDIYYCLKPPRFRDILIWDWPLYTLADRLTTAKNASDAYDKLGYSDVSNYRANLKPHRPGAHLKYAKNSSLLKAILDHTCSFEEYMKAPSITECKKMLPHLNEANNQQVKNFISKVTLPSPQSSSSASLRDQSFLLRPSESKVSVTNKKVSSATYSSGKKPSAPTTVSNRRKSDTYSDKSLSPHRPLTSLRDENTKYQTDSSRSARDDSSRRRDSSNLSKNDQISHLNDRKLKKPIRNSSGDIDSLMKPATEAAYDHLAGKSNRAIKDTKHSTKVTGEPAHSTSESKYPASSKPYKEADHTFKVPGEPASFKKPNKGLANNPLKTLQGLNSFNNSLKPEQSNPTRGLFPEGGPSKSESSVFSRAMNRVALSAQSSAEKVLLATERKLKRPVKNSSKHEQTPVSVVPPILSSGNGPPIGTGRLKMLQDKSNASSNEKLFRRESQPRVAAIQKDFDKIIKKYNEDVNNFAALKRVYKRMKKNAGKSSDGSADLIAEDLIKQGKRLAFFEACIRRNFQ
ncbi:hypothetical protein BDB01DRAFT_775928 [Pilobolus umbonatus]|nr:hypothetical protein BDB01DRAFT_775928 [Pilobolus umbonatus]